jgi:hypothetical protein
MPGLVDTSENNSFTAVTASGPVTGWQPGDEIHPGYQVTLTNTGTTTADVAGVSVIFYSGGTGTGSDQSQATGLVAPGQSLTWTETPDGWGYATYETVSAGTNESGLQGSSFSAPFTLGTEGAVDSSATCQLAGWSSGD